MQLTFTLKEFRVLVDVLVESERDAVKRGEHNYPASTLLQKALSHDLSFGFDELEDLQEILKTYAGKLSHDLDACGDESRAEVQQDKQQLLNRVMDRVTEACAMA